MCRLQDAQLFGERKRDVFLARRDFVERRSVAALQPFDAVLHDLLGRTGTGRDEDRFGGLEPRGLQFIRTVDQKRGLLNRLSYFAQTAAVGAVLVLIGTGVQVLQLLVSIKNRKKNLDVTGDPWDGRTLEWSTTSPPPFYNFAHTPIVHERDPFFIMKHADKQAQRLPYHDIHMPSNTPLGFYIGALSFLLGFGMVWHMFWLAIVSTVGIVICCIFHVCKKHHEYNLTATEIQKIEERKTPV